MEQEHFSKMTLKKSDDTENIQLLNKKYFTQARRNMGGCSVPPPPPRPQFLQSNENENRETLNQPPTQNFVPPGLSQCFSKNVLLWFNCILAHLYI